MITTMKWFNKLSKNLEEAFTEAHNIYDYPESVSADVNFNDGSFIEVELYKNNNLDVFIYHADEKVERECPNITKYLEDNLPDWEVLKEDYESYPQDEWQAHGFKDEADYWHYRLG